MTDSERYVQRLTEANPLREPLLRTVIEALHLPRGSRGLDAGCGIGLQALLLATAVGAEGHVTGVDVDPVLLAHGAQVVETSGLSGRITFREGDVGRLPCDDGAFDWVWSADCVGYPAGELAPLLHELKRVVKPGGRIVLVGWSSQALLPGYPLLEARLNATCSGYMPFLSGKGPETHFLRALRGLRAAGLHDVRAQTFAGDVQAPLTAGERQALTSLLQMVWVRPQADAAADDWAAYGRLCDPESADFILDLPDYYAFFTCSLFQGRV